MALTGPNTFFPLAAVSKKQSCVSTSTAEAELTAIFHMLRNVAIPAIDLWEIMLQRYLVVNVFEDNQAVIQIIRSGRNTTMRHFERTHRVPVAWLNEIYSRNRFLRLIYAKSDRMIADLFTKQFTDIAKFSLLKLSVGLGRSLEEIRKMVSYINKDRVWF